MDIQEKLALWYEREKRDLPWRETRDPYKIWVSEIILQQTRVSQGLNYYLNFITKFPDIWALSEASSDEVMKQWQGLGYYSRVRNMHQTAKAIAGEMNGIIPSCYKSLLNLKGIGEYTAAAIASIAFHEPVAAVDGNVKRVISRIFGVDEEINSPSGKKSINRLASEILDRNHPGRHNQAVMELGARICLPGKPLCQECPVKEFCMAYSENRVSDFPMIYKKNKSKKRFFNYLVAESGQGVLIRKRTGKDIWMGLYEFPLIESHQDEGIDRMADLAAELFSLNNSGIIFTRKSEIFVHKLSHVDIHCRFYHLRISSHHPIPEGISCVSKSELDLYPFPVLLDRYLQNSWF